MSQLKTIKLYGKLGAKFGRSFRLAVSSPAEAIQALAVQLPGFEQYLMDSTDNGQGYAVFLNKRNISKEELTLPTSASEEIRIAPIVLGSKNSGIFQIVLGAVLFVIGAVMIFVLGWTGVGAVVGMGLMSMGLSMVVGGIVQLLMPAPKGPKQRDAPDANASYTFNGPVNTQAQGNPVPLLYGELTVGSAVISAGIIANDEATAGRTDLGTPVTGGGSLSDLYHYVNSQKLDDQEELT